MPIPKPSKGEEKKKFLSRCMSNEVMLKEFPKREQRFAVCLTSWKDHNSESSSVPHGRKNVQR